MSCSLGDVPAQRAGTWASLTRAGCRGPVPADRERHIPQARLITQRTHTLTKNTPEQPHVPHSAHTVTEQNLRMFPKEPLGAVLHFGYSLTFIQLHFYYFPAVFL